MTSDSISKKKSCQWPQTIRLILIAVIAILAVLAIIFHSEISDGFMIGLEWIDDVGVFYGSMMLSCVVVVGALLFLPCLPFTLAAGYLYGCLVGTIIITIACSIASMVAFLTARYLARSLVESKLGGKSSRFRILDNAINKDGFRVVFLIRSSPLHPYGVCNYLFGLTSIPLRDYVVASTIAMVPATILEVYFGTAMKTVADLLSGRVEEDPLYRIFFWTGLVLTAGITVYVTLWVKKLLKTELEKYEYEKVPVHIEGVVDEHESTLGHSRKTLKHPYRDHLDGIDLNSAGADIDLDYPSDGDIESPIASKERITKSHVSNKSPALSPANIATTSISASSSLLSSPSPSASPSLQPAPSPNIRDKISVD